LNFIQRRMTDDHLKLATAAFARFTVAEGPVEFTVGVCLEDDARTRNVDVANRDRPEKDRQKVDLARQPIGRHHLRIVAPSGIGESNVGGDHAGREPDLRLELTVDPKFAADSIGRQSGHGVPPAAEVREVEVEEGQRDQQHGHCRDNEQQLPFTGHCRTPFRWSLSVSNAVG
jgi:hypothetical protein